MSKAKLACLRSRISMSLGNNFQKQTDEIRQCLARQAGFEPLALGRSRQRGLLLASTAPYAVRTSQGPGPRRASLTRRGPDGQVPVSALTLPVSARPF